MIANKPNWATVPCVWHGDTTQPTSCKIKRRNLLEYLREVSLNASHGAVACDCPHCAMSIASSLVVRRVTIVSLKTSNAIPSHHQNSNHGPPPPFVAADLMDSLSE
jgi:hypothetical protein